VTEQLPRRRQVLSLSLSAKNANARTVARGLAAQGVELAHGGPLILEWAAAYLEGRARAAQDEADDRLSDAELDALLDDF
jgi:hypothetical protein